MKIFILLLCIYSRFCFSAFEPSDHSFDFEHLKRTLYSSNGSKYDDDGAVNKKSLLIIFNRYGITYDEVFGFKLNSITPPLSKLKGQMLDIIKKEEALQHENQEIEKEYNIQRQSEPAEAVENLVKKSRAFERKKFQLEMQKVDIMHQYETIVTSKISPYHL